MQKLQRLKREKEKKVRVNVTIDESIYIKYGLYIDNLSSFLNQSLKNYIKLKESELQDLDSEKNLLCCNYDNKKSQSFIDSYSNLEALEIAKTKWIKD